MSDDRMPRWLQSVADKMLADFNASGAVEHRASKGSERESVLRMQYLDKYLPGSVRAIGSGEAVEVGGNTSRQADIMIVDPSTPPLWDGNDFRVVPVECVHGAIEVKSYLSTTELENAWKNLRSIKSLTKSAFGSRLGQVQRSVYGKTWDYMPVAGMVFGYEGAEIETLGQTLADLAGGEDDLALRVDSVWVLNKGYLTWRDHDTGLINPQSLGNDDLQAVKASPAETLMALTAHLNSIYANAFMPALDVKQYLKGSWGISGKTWSQHDEPGQWLQGISGISEVPQEEIIDGGRP